MVFGHLLHFQLAFGIIHNTRAYPEIFIGGARSGVVWGGDLTLPSGDGSGRGRGTAPSQKIFLTFQMEMVHLYALSLLKVKTSQPQPITTDST